MTKKEAIEQSIDHWKRMIEWVKKQPEGKVNSSKMYNELSELWVGRDCALCKRADYCLLCPLVKAGHCCEEEGSLWKKVYKSKTWKTWLKNASKMLRALQSL